MAERKEVQRKPTITLTGLCQRDSGRDLSLSLSFLFLRLSFQGLNREFAVVVQSVTQSCPILQPNGLQAARLPCPQKTPGSKIGVSCHSLLQGIFPTQGLNLGLLPCRLIHYYLSHQCKQKKICSVDYNTKNKTNIHNINNWIIK